MPFDDLAIDLRNLVGDRTQLDKEIEKLVIKSDEYESLMEECREKVEKKETLRMNLGDTINRVLGSASFDMLQGSELEDVIKDASLVLFQKQPILNLNMYNPTSLHASIIYNFEFPNKGVKAEFKKIKPAELPKTGWEPVTWEVNRHQQMIFAGGSSWSLDDPQEYYVIRRPRSDYKSPNNILLQVRIGTNVAFDGSLFTGTIDKLYLSSKMPNIKGVWQEDPTLFFGNRHLLCEAKASDSAMGKYSQFVLPDGMGITPALQGTVKYFKEICDGKRPLIVEQL